MYIYISYSFIVHSSVHGEPVTSCTGVYRFCLIPGLTTLPLGPLSVGLVLGQGPTSGLVAGFVHDRSVTNCDICTLPKT